MENGIAIRIKKSLKPFMRTFPFRIILPAVLSVILLVWTIFVFLLPSFEETLIARKKQLVQELVNSAHSILKEYRDREDAGELTREEAQLRAKKQISSMRYGDELKDYFWINTIEPRMVMHPYRPELVGKNLSSYKDLRGKRIFIEAAVIVSKQGSGFVDYMWQWKDDPERIVQKVSYVKGFEPWGWIIGSGIYIEDVHAEISLITSRLYVILSMILCIIVLLTAFIIWQGIKAERLKGLAENNLKISEKKYRELVQDANSIILRLDKNGDMLFINEFAQDFFGFAEHEMIGRNVVGTIVPEISSAGQNLKKFIASLCADPQQYSTNENENIKKNGERVWIAWTNKAVLDKFGEVDAVLCVGNDITETKQAEQALRESEERIRTVVDQAGDAFFLLDDSGNFIDVNKHACEILGYTRDEMVHMGVPDIDIEFSPERIRGFIKILESGNFATLESIHRTKDGRQFPVEIRCGKSIVKGAERIVALSRDITDRKRMEEALQESEKKYRGLYNNAQVGMALTAVSDGKMIECNHKMAKILGYETREQCISECILSNQYVDPQKRQELTEALEYDGVVNESIVQFYRRDKMQVWVRMSCFFYHDIKCIESVVVDITQQKQAEQEALRSARLASIGELAAGVAHEVNNPLNGIINCAELIKDILSEKRLDTKWSEAIIRESRRIARIVQSLLSYARPMDEKYGIYSIKNILDETLLLLQKTFDKNSVTLLVEISKNLSKVYVQPQKIQEVLMNILTNALYAVNQKLGSELNKKRVEIKTSMVESGGKEYVRMVFSDNGTGIPEKNLNRICDPFYSLKPAGEGSGLGLNICYNIIKEHNGRLFFESREGHYTRVIVDLPAVRDNNI